MNGVFLMLGGNLGDVATTFNQAVSLLNASSVKVLRCSKYFITPAWPDPSQPEYLNMAVEVEWDGTPDELLAITQSVEHELGRVRSVRNANRTLDIDIVLFGSKVLDTELLQVPHPRMHERLFVLDPLCDLAPDFIHPILGEKLEVLRFSLKNG